MARPTAVRRGPRGALIAAISSIAVIGVVVTLAVTAQGYESQQVPRLESMVWVTRDSGQYARVNTELAEIDTVRAVDDPSSVVQSGATSVVYSQGFRQRWAVDAASPIDLVSDTETEEAPDDAPAESAPTGSEATPAGTREIISAGGYVVYRTDTGQVFLGTVDPDSGILPIDPFATVETEEGEEPPTYVASAVAVSPSGLVALYSADEGAVRVYDGATQEFRGDPEPVASGPDAEARLEFSFVAGRWVLGEPAEDRLWIAGSPDPVTVDLGTEARFQSSADLGTSLLIADGAGLVEVTLDDGSAERIADATGTPAAPVVTGTDAYAAWLTPETGALWSRSTGETIPLDTPGDVFESAQAVVPVLRSNGDRAVLNETVTGLLWTVPDGAIIPLEQWSVDDQNDEDQGTIVVEDVAEPEPPVAVDDAFGVRAGDLVLLPVLLNDHDPNKKDVLTIEPTSLSGLSDPGFGELSIIGNSQSIAVRVAAESGQATFTYSVTDGSAVSPPATVTLTVIDPSENSAPEWCGVEACQQEWPSPQLLPGGTVIVPVLNAWVDPEGDTFILSDARAVDTEAPVSVVPMSDGRVAIRHTDANASDAVISVQITVTDIFGASAEKTLEVLVTSAPSLVAAPVAVTAGAGEAVSVRVAEHVTGGSGSYRLVDAVETSADAAGLLVSPNAAAGEIDLSAPEPGQYVVTYSVVDAISLAEQSAIIRLTVVGEGVPLAVAPMTAFVRAGEDTSVDVFGAVQNTTGRVLLLSEATSSTPELSVGLVGQSQLRVSGTTPNGQPGLVGEARVTIADGAGAAVTGTVAVFLAASANDVDPIALPDTVTVRAGELVRIPVAENDVSPRGARLVVHPEVSGSGTEGELVFAAGNSVRYLAPTTPGTYRLGYSIALESDPSRTDNTSITVTVLPSGVNRPPKPAVLNARVLSGQSVEIPVPTYGVDPDGDRVVLVGADQPGANKGTTSVSAEGDSIIYTAPAAGVSGGQLTFAYTVRDSGGAEGTGSVRVGVLNAELADTAPVTFSDYVRVQRGAATPVTIQPLLNDRDPAQGTLELVDLVPNAPAGTTEYARLADLVDSGTSLESGRVMLRAGDVAGTNSFVYTVRSSVSSSTAQGLIVVGVSDDAAADQPVVTDTILTARNRGDLEKSGIDVVTGRVQWASGDVSTLRLSLWGPNSSRYDVSGSRITGTLPEKGDLVPFQLTGQDASGGDVVSYGFLRIPAFDDMRVQLAGSVEPLDVDEEKSVTIEVRELVDLAASDRIELREGDFTTQRAAASCTPSGPEKAVYAAGREAPWSDSCLIPLRLDGQTTWSYVVVPIDIRPKNPQAILSALSRTIAPAASESIDLYSAMTTWEGGREGDLSKLDYQVAYAGSAFTMTQGGGQVSFEARADAPPGTRETATVSVSSFGGLSATITLVVGAAPPDAPRGATFSRECTVSAGTCSIPVVGVGGEYDPFAGKTGSGLKLVSVGGGGAVTCDVTTVTAAGETSVSAVFPAGQAAFGGQCVVPFTVADAQGRTGPGTLTIDVQGYPQRPASVTTVDYSGSSVTLEVPLGEAARAQPAVTGVAIYSGGRSTGASCSPSGTVYRCVVSGLTNGERREYTARAVNSVGESTDTSAVTSWAYQAPEISSATASPVYERGRTSPSNAVVEIVVKSSDDTRQFRIDGVGQFDRQGGTTTYRLDTAPGGQVFTVVPISRFEPPIAGSTDGAAKTLTVNAAGGPIFSNGVSASAATSTSITVSGGDLDMNGSGRERQRIYVAWRGGNEPECRVNGEGGGLSIAGGEEQSTSSSITGLQSYELYNVKACGSNGYGVVSSNVAQVFTFDSNQPPGTGGEASYTVDTNPSQDGRVYNYGLAQGPSVTPPDGRFTVQYRTYGDWSESFQLSPDALPDAKARACRNGFLGQYCSNEQGLTANTAPTTVRVEFLDRRPVVGPPSDPNRFANLDRDVRDMIRVSNAASGSWSFVATPNADGSQAEVIITWSGAFAQLTSISRTIDLDPQPEPEVPDPEDPEVPENPENPNPPANPNP